MGIQGLACHSGGQGGDPFAAVCSGIPTQETVTVLLALGTDLIGQCAVEALDPDGHILALVGAGGVVELHIGIVGRNDGGINAVKVQVSLHQTAIDQTQAGAAAGNGPLGHGIEEIVSGPIVQHSILNLGAAGTAHPAGTDIICKGNQCIELILGQIQVICLVVVVDRLHKARQFLCQQRLGLSLGDAVGHILVQLVVRAAGAVADGILAVIPVGLFAESLKILDERDAGITGFPVICSKSGHRYHTQHQNQSQNQDQSSPFHRKFLLLLIVCEHYITFINKTQAFRNKKLHFVTFRVFAPIFSIDIQFTHWYTPIIN